MTLRAANAQASYQNDGAQANQTAATYGNAANEHQQAKCANERAELIAAALGVKAFATMWANTRAAIHLLTTVWTFLHGRCTSFLKAR